MYAAMLWFILTLLAAYAALSHKSIVAYAVNHYGMSIVLLLAILIPLYPAFLVTLALVWNCYYIPEDNRLEKDRLLDSLMVEELPGSKEGSAGIKLADGLTIPKLQSLALSGVSGSGKSTYLAQVAKQLVPEYNPEDIVVYDAHSDSEEGIAQRLSLSNCTLVTLPTQLTDMLNTYNESKQPCLFIIDEFISAVKRDKSVLDSLLVMLTEGRKYGQVVLTASHFWNSKLTGTEVRDSFTTFVLLRQKRSQATVTLGYSEDVPVTDKFHTGEAYIVDSRYGVEGTYKW